MATIVFVADGWGSQYGGINSFNYDLCLNMHSILDLEEHCVICVTTGETLREQDYENAKEKGLLYGLFLLKYCSKLPLIQESG